MNDKPVLTVAIIGASADRSKFGNQSVRAHLQSGYTVYPVNPKADEIEGLTVYRSLKDITLHETQQLTRVSMYVPPAVGMTLLQEIAEIGCDELWLNPGSESPEMIAAAEALGLNVIQACSIVNVQT